MASRGQKAVPQWKVALRLVTREQAKVWLSKMGQNRKLNESWVVAYQRAMDAGLWDTDPGRTPIALDNEGRLINGQHRLAAFLRSKLDTLTIMVATNCPPESYETFDQDAFRRGTKQAHLGRQCVSRDMARVKWLEAIISADSNRKITNVLFDELADRKYRRELEWAGEVLPHGGRQGKASYASTLMYVYRVDPDFADTIAKPWANGGAGLPAQLIRLRDNALATRPDQREAVRVTLKMLGALACMHQRKPLPSSLQPNLVGLRYFSALAKDGAATRWERSVIDGE